MPCENVTIPGPSGGGGGTGGGNGGTGGDNGSTGGDNGGTGGGNGGTGGENGGGTPGGGSPGGGGQEQNPTQFLRDPRVLAGIGALGIGAIALSSGGDRSIVRRAMPRRFPRRAPGVTRTNNGGNNQ